MYVAINGTYAFQSSSWQLNTNDSQVGPSQASALCATRGEAGGGNKTEMGDEKWFKCGICMELEPVLEGCYFRPMSEGVANIASK